LAIFQKPQEMVADTCHHHIIVTRYFIGIWGSFRVSTICIYFILMKREKSIDTCLTLVLALIVFYKIYKYESLLLIALIIGVIGLFIPSLAQKIHWAWMKFAEFLGFVMSKIILTLIFFIVLLPFSYFSDLRKNNQLKRKSKKDSHFVTRNFMYNPESMENMW
jgi:hypothetical protein